MEEQIEEIYLDYRPGVISWLTACLCTLFFVYLIIQSNKFFTGVHSAAIRDRIINLIDTNIRPDVILEDEYIKSKPEKNLIKIQRAIALYNSIYSDLLDRSKIMVDEPVVNPSKALIELRTTISTLSQKTKILPQEKNPPTQDEIKKIKDRSLELAKDLIREESLPEVSALSELTYKKLKKFT